MPKICRFCRVNKVTAAQLRDQGDMCNECRAYYENLYGLDMTAAEWENWFESFER